MAIVFPPVDSASPEGLLAIGGNLEPLTLINAYKQGVFPWPISENSPLTWFCPDPRGILYTDKFSVNKSMRKFIKSTDLEIRYNTEFESVIRNCQNVPRQHEEGTWITDDIIAAYTNLFDLEKAYCVSVYQKNKLVGGLYGVCINGYLSGESMFYKRDNASKLALCGLINALRNADIPWLDTQMVTPVISSMGGELISRDQFLQQLPKQINLDKTRDDIFTSNLDLQDLLSQQHN